MMICLLDRLRGPFVGFLMFMVLGLASSLWGRTWRSENGYACEAEFIRFEEETKSVVIKRAPDGKELTIEIKKLSKDDRDYLKQKWNELHQPEPEAAPRPEPRRRRAEQPPPQPPQPQQQPPPAAVDSGGKGILALFGVVVFVLGLIVAAVGGIWILIVAFQESVVWGLLCLLTNGIGSLMFVITHWDDAKKPFLVQLGGVGLCVIAFLLMLA